MCGLRFLISIRSCLLAVPLALGGCGIFEFDDDVAAPNGMVMGMALKGVLKNALVTVEEIVPGAAPKILGRACTSATGSYSLTYAGYNGGPMLISVDPVNAATGGCLGNNQATISTCDAAAGCGATAFGADFVVPAGTNLNLHALIGNAGVVQVAAITPFSEAAARTALRAINGAPVTNVDNVVFSGVNATGLELLAQNAEAALSQIENLPLFSGLGADFDLLTTLPADITEDFDGSDNALSGAENQAAGFGTLCGAVLQAFFSDGGSSADPAAALSAATDKLAKSFTADGILNDDDGSGTDASAFSMEEITEAARMQASTSGATTTSGYNDSNLDGQETASTNQPGFSNPPPDASSLLSWNLGSWDLSLWQ